MKQSTFEKKAKGLVKWAHNSGERIRFINGYLCYSIALKGGVLTLTESDNGGNYPGEEIDLTAAQIESMDFNEEAYQFEIVTTEDGAHKGQGYDIEVYNLERVEF